MGIEHLHTPEAKAKRAANRKAKGPAPSLRKAINDKCADCIYDPLAGGSRARQIDECSATDCPLWPVRPRRKVTGRQNIDSEPATPSSDQRNQAIGSREYLAEGGS